MPEPVRPAYHLYRWMWGSLDYIFPPDCGGCGESGHLWCAPCQLKVKEIIGSICSYCGQPWKTPGLCFRCDKRQPNFSMLRSWALYVGPVREAIQRLKYRRNVSLGFIFTEYLYRLVRENGWRVDAVIPVPLGVARLQERGYNQAVLIAQPLALRIGKPCLKRGLIRVRETRSQVGLSYAERLANVSTAFEGNKNFVSGLHVLVVDDVATSSATLDACALALLQAGAGEVNCVTLARAI
jgi:competence protein ComFC